MKGKKCWFLFPLLIPPWLLQQLTSTRPCPLESGCQPEKGGEALRPPPDVFSQPKGFNSRITSAQFLTSHLPGSSVSGRHGLRLSFQLFGPSNKKGREFTVGRKTNGTDPHANGTEPALAAPGAQPGNYHKARASQLHGPQRAPRSPLADVVFSERFSFDLVWVLMTKEFTVLQKT